MSINCARQLSPLPEEPSAVYDDVGAALPEMTGNTASRSQRTLALAAEWHGAFEDTLAGGWYADGDAEFDSLDYLLAENEASRRAMDVRVHPYDADTPKSSPLTIRRRRPLALTSKQSEGSRPTSPTALDALLASLEVASTNADARDLSAAPSCMHHDGGAQTLPAHVRAFENELSCVTSDAPAGDPLSCPGSQPPSPPPPSVSMGLPMNLPVWRPSAPPWHAGLGTPPRVPTNLVPPWLARPDPDPPHVGNLLSPAFSDGSLLSVPVGSDTSAVGNVLDDRSFGCRQGWPGATGQASSAAPMWCPSKGIPVQRLPLKVRVDSGPTNDFGELEL